MSVAPQEGHGRSRPQRRGLRPLDWVPSLKMKLGAVIVAAISVTAVAIAIGHDKGLPLVVVTGGAIVLGLGMVHVLARGMTSPLREMATAAAAMAEGHYEWRVRATSRDEVGELARAFNRMSAELAGVDRMRRDLVANVSHELRTPISALGAVLENLVDGVEEPDRETFEAMLAQVQRLGRLVGQLLDLSRLESGAVPFEVRPFAIRPVLEDAVREARLLDASVRLSVEVDPSDLAAVGDPERIYQVVANLLENAVRHSPEGGLVAVVASGNATHARIAIVDEGAGITPADADRVFERFYRTDAARSSGDGGTGLGLSISRWIVELHGGDIRVEDREPHGCRMVVDLPLAAI
ncbi:MAG: HAMP domain-containing histidine kinase [Actinomycetota bacterium]|nr:HAMP domain-containing histidine kinase [Actinomycetota bacterium]